jgi:cell division GTPase FtsZ
LINVTAGMDLRTSEFHVVGDTVKQYASEDATVVVGYVIDPDMTDTIRVTVVATGIGRPAAVARHAAGGAAEGRSRGGPSCAPVDRQLCGFRHAGVPSPAPASRR